VVVLDGDNDFTSDNSCEIASSVIVEDPETDDELLNKSLCDCTLNIGSISRIWDTLKVTKLVIIYSGSVVI